MIRFILQSARYYWKGHLGLLFGAFLASAVLTGSLLVGDSVRASLRRVADLRLGKVQSGVLGGDRWFTNDLAKKSGAVPLIIANGAVSSGAGGKRVNAVQVLGVDADFWKLSTSGKDVPLASGEVAVNAAMAHKLGVGVGDTILVRLERPSAISRDAPLSGSTNEEVTLRRKVASVVSAEDFGAFQLVAAQTSPDSVFVGLEDLQSQIETEGRVNAALSNAAASMDVWEKNKTIKDFALTLARVDGASKEWQIGTDRVFVDGVIASELLKRPGSYGVMTYLVNGLVSAKGGVPYSMVTAVTTPALQAGEGITITQWLAEDQKLAIGDDLTLKYFVVGTGRALTQAEATFKVTGILPMTDPVVNRTWTPEFPGVSDVDNCRDWEPGIPMDMKAIRDQDEKYWDDYKGTPKGFISLAAGQKLWTNRFGELTSIRFPDKGEDEAKLAAELMAPLRLADIGLAVRDLKGEASAAAKGSVDFGGLFIGLSMFLIGAALVFAALLFLFTLERRAGQVGVLMAMGWTPKLVRKAVLGEAGCIAILGVALGIWGGGVYTKLALQGLMGVWSGAAQGLPLIYAPSAGTMAGAATGALLVVLLTLWWASRKLFKTAPRLLMAGGGTTEAARTGKDRTIFVAILSIAAALGMMYGGTVAKGAEEVAGLFFGSGMMLLIAGLAVALHWMRRGRSNSEPAQSLNQIGMISVKRRPSRSLAVIGMMAGGIFLVTAVNAFRMTADDDATKRDTGTGGFALLGESSLPVYETLTAKAGIDAFGLDEAMMRDVSVVPFRIREGDDASCLNLNRAQRPVLVGVDSALLAERKAFAFASGGEEGWSALKSDGDVIPAIADQATAMWGLGLGIGDTLKYEDASGREFEVKLVGMLAGSVLQGKMIIDEKPFLTHFPDASGYRFFLIDAPEGRAADLSAHLTRQLEKRGLALEPVNDRLESFLSVQNTYIGIFTVLGGLGVLLGTAGLGVLVARHVLERKGELGLMQALGFRQGNLRLMVLSEHVVLLISGLVLGTVSALVAVWPTLRQSAQSLPLGFLGILWLAVLAFGIAACAVAVTAALRGRLLDAVRRE